MTTHLLSIKFKELPEFKMNFKAKEPTKTQLTSWVTLDSFPCPVNQSHGPNLNYCRLAIEISRLVDYFDDINSIERGQLCLRVEEGTEICSTNDAQTIFFKAFWFVLLKSQCSVFKLSQWARSNYIPTSSPKRLLYTFFSVFLVECYMDEKKQPINLQNFKKRMKLNKDVLDNLLTRVRRLKQTESDTVANGLVLFINLISLLDIEFDSFLSELQNQINKDSITIAKLSTNYG